MRTVPAVLGKVEKAVGVVILEQMRDLVRRGVKGTIVGGVLVLGVSVKVKNEESPQSTADEIEPSVVMIDSLRVGKALVGVPMTKKRVIAPTKAASPRLVEFVVVKAAAALVMKKKSK